MNPERKKLVHETTEMDLVFRRMNTTWARIKRRRYYITRIFEVATIFVESSYSDLPSCDRSPSVFAPRRRQSPPRLPRLLLPPRRRLLLPHAPQCRGARLPSTGCGRFPVTGNTGSTGSADGGPPGAYPDRGPKYRSQIDVFVSIISFSPFFSFLLIKKFP